MDKRGLMNELSTHKAGNTAIGWCKKLHVLRKVKWKPFTETFWIFRACETN